MPARLALCDLGAPGWGEPWFPHSAVLLYSHMGMAIFVMFVFSVLFFCFYCHTNTSDDTRISCFFIPRSHNWSAGHFSPAGFGLCGVFLFVLLVCFFCLVLFCFSVFAL